MKFTQWGLLVLVLFFSLPSMAGSSTGPVTVKKILTWTNGDYKVYFNETEKVNGKEGCTATDGSVAVVSTPENQHGEQNILNQFMQAQLTGKKVNVFVVGCCKNHSKKQSPCVRTATGF